MPFRSRTSSTQNHLSGSRFRDWWHELTRLPDYRQTCFLSSGWPPLISLVSGSPNNSHHHGDRLTGLRRAVPWAILWWSRIYLDAAFPGRHGQHLHDSRNPSQLSCCPFPTSLHTIGITETLSRIKKPSHRSTKLSFRLSNRPC